MDKNAEKTEASTSVVIMDFEQVMGLTRLKPGIRFDRELLETYISAAAPNSIRALKQDTEAFDLWCRRQGVHSFPATPKQVADWLKVSEITHGPIFRRVIVRRYAAKPARKRIDPATVSGRAIWKLSRFAPKSAKAARVEYEIGDKALHSGSVTPIIRKMIEQAIASDRFGDIEKAKAKELVADFSSHSTRVGLNQDLFAVGETLAGIMDALRWKSPKMPLVYNRNLAAEIGAAGRLLSKLD